MTNEIILSNQGKHIISGLGKPANIIHPGSSGASLTRGAGNNIPNGGAGWSLWMELDVTQNDQSVLESSLGYISTTSFTGTRWNTPDGDGSGAYFDQVVGGRRCMEFRWGAGGTSEGQCAINEWSSNPTDYDEMYQRAIVRLTPQEHWPSNAIKLLRTLRNVGGTANGFFNLSATSVTNPPTPWKIAFTNIFSSGTTPSGTVGMQYITGNSYGPSNYNEWFEVELWHKKNSSNGVLDGRSWAYVGTVGSPTRVNDFDGSDGDPNQNVDELTNIAWVSGGTSVGHGHYQLSPYLGGGPGATLTQDQSILFATLSIWVK